MGGGHGASALQMTDRLDLPACREIGRIWSEVLGIPGAAPEKSFLASGGDSLRAMQLCALVAQRHGMKVSLRDVLEAESPAQLAAMLAQPPDLRTHTFLTATGEPLDTALSYAQQRMLFMHELAAGSAAYHATMAWRLAGRLDIEALAAALHAVSLRHESLRMRIVRHDEGQQACYDVLDPPVLARLGESHSPPAADGGAVQKILCAFANEPFRLERGPLWRTGLVRLQGGDHILVVVIHHIAADQWSLDVFFRDLAAAYNARRDAPLPAVADPAIGRYSSAYRRWFEAERRETELEFWVNRLHGSTPTALNEDYVRPPQQRFYGRKLVVELPRRELLALRALGAEHRASLAAVFLAALNVLLHRYTGRNDIVVGVPAACREHPDSWNLITCTINTLVVRSDLEGMPSFAEALARVRDSLQDSIEHQNLPFDELVRTTGTSRDPSRPPLFSVMLNMLNTPLGEVQWNGLQWSRFEYDKQAAQFDLSLTIDADHARTICFEYATSVFSAQTIAQIAEHYFELLRAIVRQPDAGIHVLRLSSDEERKRLGDWSHGPRTARTSSTIDELVARHFITSAERIAIRHEGTAWTYAELSRRVDAFASGLAALGAGPGTLVGLHLHRGPEMVAALLGVLRTGAAYVPLDPGFPAERLTYTAADARITLVLTAGGEGSPAWPAQCRVVSPGQATAARPSSRPDRRAQPDSPAYVIYTSGSTGQPKGVVVPHGAVVNFLLSMQTTPGLGAADRLLAVTTLSFDIAVLELLLPLSRGAMVVIAPTSAVADGQALRALIKEHDITVMQATPSTWHIVIDSGWSGSRNLRAFVGGETLSSTLASQLLARCSEVWNLYGPTETTVWSACGQVEAPGLHRISLGQPIANTQILVLDENLGICPAGVAGEICIGGNGLALGYLNRPELTAASFIQNPHSRDRRERRLYRTGDRGRWRLDGRLEHLGRIDAQLKIRGHRVEPGEIEARLQSHARIKGAVVGTRLLDSAETLIAWLVPDGAPVAEPELRAYLAEWLPSSMIPQHFVTIHALPRLPNGKLDHFALPSPDLARAGGATRQPPRGETEELLLLIWKEVLQRDDFGVLDNLFAIGGHSLMAARIVNRVRENLGRECSLSMLLANPTVASLARALAQETAIPGSTLVQLQRGSEGPELFCLCGIMIYRELAEHLDADVPVCGVYVPQELAFFGDEQGGGRLPDVRELARLYLNAIRSRQPVGPYRLVGFSFGGVVAFEVTHQLRALGEQVELLAILDSDAPGPPLAGSWLQGTVRKLKVWARGILTRGENEPNPYYLSAMRRYDAPRYQGEVMLVQTNTPASHDPGYGWERFAPGASHLHVDTTHLGLLKGDSARQVADFLRPVLTRSRPAA